VPKPNQPNFSYQSLYVWSDDILDPIDLSGAEKLAYVKKILAKAFPETLDCRIQTYLVAELENICDGFGRRKHGD
jgi:hypothetical protein